MSQNGSKSSRKVRGPAADHERAQFVESERNRRKARKGSMEAPPPSEQFIRVRSFLGPEGSIVYDWVRWQDSQTDAPTMFHVGAALTLLSALAPLDTYVRFKAASKEKPNLFVMLVGGSGRARKGASLSPVLSMLQKIASQEEDFKSLWSPRFASFPRMVDHLQADPVTGKGTATAWIDGEFSTFLSEAQGKNGPGNQVKLGLTDAFDGNALTYDSRGSGLSEARDYRFTMGVAISNTYLKDYCTPSDLTGGFMSRFLIIEDDRQHFIIPDDSPWADSQRSALYAKLVHFARSAPRGTYQFESEECTDAYNGWAYDVEMASRAAVEREQGFLQRGAAMLRKVVTLFAMDRLVSSGVVHNEALGDDQVHHITMEDLQRAINLVDVHLTCAMRVASQCGATFDGRIKQAIVKLIRDANGAPVARGYLTEHLGFVAGKIMPYLTTLVEENKVVAISVSASESDQQSRGGVFYVLHKAERELGAFGTTPVADTSHYAEMAGPQVMRQVEADARRIEASYSGGIGSDPDAPVDPSMLSH